MRSNTDNTPPRRRQVVRELVGHIGLIGFGLWLWSYKGPWWWVGAAIAVGFGVLMIRPVWRLWVAQQHINQQEEWINDAVVIVRGKTATMATSDDVVVQDLVKQRSGWVIGVKDNQVLVHNPFQPGHGHGLCVGPTGSGKSSCVVTPTILNFANEDMCGMVNDPKGEQWYQNFEHLRRSGLEPVPLNSFGVEDIPVLDFNPMYKLTDDYKFNDGREAVEWAQINAAAIMPVPPGGVGDNTVFVQGAQRLSVALQNAMAVFMPEDCNPITLFELTMSDTKRLQAVARRMQHCEEYRGQIRMLGNELADMLDPNFRKTFTAYLQDAREGVKIYSPASDWAPRLKRCDFKLTDIIEGGKILFNIMHRKKISTHGGYSSWIMTLFIETKARHDKYVKTVMLMDEMGTLPLIPEETFSNALALLRSTGLRMYNFFQSPAQIDRYSPLISKMIRDQSSLVHAWGIRDLEMQKEWAARCGMTTCKESSFQQSPLEQDYGFSKTYSERQEQVFSETEISRMKSNEQLIWVAGGHSVIKASLEPYWKIHPFRSLASPNPCEGGGYPKNEDIEYYF